ncbi:TIGR02594 family protein [Sphingomonas sp. VDB2]|uniref:TIGR02594 family protein n=1 Tax=Sphingomonas sp. VDB2 TaxID=3228751 RepID=UPI003A8080C5|nr:TIGR02594 family protein [Sphingobium sp.]
MPQIPPKYAFLRQNPLPPLMVRVAMEMLGTLENPGSGNNPVILGWADEVARTCGRPYDKWAADFYNADSIPWCGLFMAVVAARTCQGRPERMPPKNYLAALAWSNWGQVVPPKEIQVGDVIVLVRNGGGHVFLAVGVSADGKRIMGIGGNQRDRVCFADFDAARLYAVRRPAYREKPAGARRVILATDGSVSIEEG